jgi:hypothetical protein
VDVVRGAILRAVVALWVPYGKRKYDLRPISEVAAEMPGV